MTAFSDVLGEAVRAARAGQWPAHRLQFAALREALDERLGPSDEDLRNCLDILNSAMPSQDPEGYLAELDQLVSLVRERGVPEFDIVERVATLDLRGLQPPEPIMRIFEALERAPGEPLRAILPHEPVPLYALLLNRGFSYNGSQRADGGFELLIVRS